MQVAYELGTKLKKFCLNVCTDITSQPPHPPLCLHVFAFWSTLPLLKCKRNNWMSNVPLYYTCYVYSKAFSYKFQIGRKILLRLFQQTERQARNWNKPLPWDFAVFFWFLVEREILNFQVLKCKQSFRS